MTSAVLAPVRVHARPDPTLNRWLWLVKWLLVLPHLVLLALLWPAFAVLSVIALVAIAITGRYPQPLFDFNVGVLRWTWRVAYYAYGALATDRYPPFSLGEHPEYPATLDIPYPPRLSRGLVLVKWFLALPHLLIVAVFIGAGTYLVSQTGQWALNLGGLIGLLTLAAGVALLFTGRYPQGLFDFILGLDRWVLRVAAYVGLMTDTYPPFRLDLGGPDPAAAAIVPTPPRTARPPAPWGAGRITAAVVGSLMILAGLGTAGGGITLGIIDQTRTDTGLISTSPVTIDIDAAAARLGPFDLTWTGPAEWTAASALGQVQVTGRAANTDTALFIGIGPAAAVADYLAGVRTAQLTPLGAVITATDGPADTPANPPAAQGFWSAASSGTGAQTLTWSSAPGSWTLVIMNADGSAGVRATATLAAAAPALASLVLALLITGALLALSGAGLVIAATMTRRHHAPTAPPFDPTHTLTRGTGPS